MLTGAGVSLVVDVRRFPHSRRHPRFDQRELAVSLESAGIGYVHVPELGGRRPRSDLPKDVNGFWRNESFHNYADYALSGQFQDALRELLSLGNRETCAVMCAEAVWWRCHRRIIADYLLYHGAEVVHLMGDGRTQAARLTDSATLASNGGLVYPDGAAQPEKR